MTKISPGLMAALHSGHGSDSPAIAQQFFFGFAFCVFIVFSF
ncbi:hypothetical protein [Halioglobus sp. Uisw_031]